MPESLVSAAGGILGELLNEVKGTSERFLLDLGVNKFLGSHFTANLPSDGLYVLLIFAHPLRSLEIVASSADIWTKVTITPPGVSEIM